MGLAKDVLRKILDGAHKLGLKSISSAEVNIGETLISDRQEFLELFKQVSAGTPAEGMEIKTTIMPLMAFCKKCNVEFTPKQMKMGCPECDTLDFKIVSGKEIVIKELK